MRAARAVVEAVAHGAHEHTYGVNTGFGRFVSKSIPEEQTEELQLRLLRSHACGVGEPYPDAVVRAAMLLRANALAKGNSGARVETVELLLECLNRGVLPFVPARGSVGASGDLAPLAHLALPLVGEGRAWWEGELLDGGEALARAGLEPVRLRREGGPVADQRHAVHGRAGRARARARLAARPRGRLRVRAVARGAAGLAQLVHPAGARAAAAARPGGVGPQRPAPARRLGDQRVASLVRQGAGRVLASLRAAGARRVARPARLRRLHRLDGAELGDRQPARPRRRRDARVGGQLPRPAARVRARCARDGGRRAREHLGAARRAARQPEPERRAAGVPDDRRRAELRAS